MSFHWERVCLYLVTIIWYAVLIYTSSQRASATIERDPWECEDSGSLIFYRCKCSCCIHQEGKQQNTYSPKAHLVDADNSSIEEEPTHFEKFWGLSQLTFLDSKLAEHLIMLGTWGWNYWISKYLGPSSHNILVGFAELMNCKTDGVGLLDSWLKQLAESEGRVKFMMTCFRFWLLWFCISLGHFDCYLPFDDWKSSYAEIVKINFCFTFCK